MSETGLDPKIAAHEAAREYAWNWFAYHAGQRQAVFRFYVILSGVVSTGYITTANSTNTDLQSISFIFGLVLVVLSFLFWRLDVRSIVLIKLAESFLKIEEKRLGTALDTDQILLATKSDEGRDKIYFRKIYSFRQVYQIVFSGVGALGAAIFVWGGIGPVKNWISTVAIFFCSQ